MRKEQTGKPILDALVNASESFADTPAPASGNCQTSKSWFTVMSDDGDEPQLIFEGDKDHVIETLQQYHPQTVRVTEWTGNESNPDRVESLNGEEWLRQHAASHSPLQILNNAVDYIRSLKSTQPGYADKVQDAVDNAQQLADFVQSIAALDLAAVDCGMIPTDTWKRLHAKAREVLAQWEKDKQ